MSQQHKQDEDQDQIKTRSKPGKITREMAHTIS